MDRWSVFYTNVETAGQVKDKFTKNYADGIFTTIAEDWRRPNNAPPGHCPGDLAFAGSPFRRSAAGRAFFGRWSLGRGERLHATRSMGQGYTS